MDGFFLVESMTSCVEWAVALAVIGVGAGPVRSAHAQAGYLTIATGALWLFAACCAYLPSLHWQLAPSGDLEAVATLLSWGTLLFSAAGVGALLGAAAVLARALQAPGGAR